MPVILEPGFLLLDSKVLLKSFDLPLRSSQTTGRDVALKMRNCMRIFNHPIRQVDAEHWPWAAAYRSGNRSMFWMANYPP